MRDRRVFTYHVEKVAEIVYVKKNFPPVTLAALEERPIVLHCKANDSTRRLLGGRGDKLDDLALALQRERRNPTRSPSMLYSRILCIRALTIDRRTRCINITL